MVDAMRAMLDELMGKERDAPLAERSNRKIVFSDKDVCKYDLVSVCPHQLFTNTRSDLGERAHRSARLRSPPPRRSAGAAAWAGAGGSLQHR